mmetsp:Transcript_1747/g.4401  ORF Transcript_1747/g.4401 Transcript_1747/m.4401 type:complete len:596 (+) Transcript_1747:63-1850(+)
MDDDDFSLSMSQHAHVADVARGSLRSGFGPGFLDGGLNDPPALPSRRHGKYFNDPLHGHIWMHPTYLDFIDTPAFQRLRSLHQLGLTYYVYDGASHKRFEHCLGVSHIACSVAERIWMMQGSNKGYGVISGDTVDINRRDVLVTGLAGLCHDLGHGPFSHVFDREFLKAKGIIDWDHEEMSCKMFDHIRDEGNIDSISDEEAKMVKLMIPGGPEHRNQAPEEKRFLFDIVANYRNSIDVDKFDYLQRDAQNCGVKVSCDFNRLIQFSKVIQNEICFKWSEYLNIAELFHSRSIMHRKVYTHRKAKAIEFMVVDALLEADQTLRLTDKIHSPQDFIHLNDSILETISSYGFFFPGTLPEEVQGPMKRAQAIVEQLRRRQLYRYVNELMVPSHELKHYKPPSPAELCSYYHSDGEVSLDPSKVIVSMSEINWTKKGTNPIDRVGFFDSYDDTEKREVHAHQITSMMPSEFQERSLRVYSRDRNPKVCAALNKAIDNYRRKQWGAKVELATPCKGSGGGEGSQPSLPSAGVHFPEGSLRPSSQALRAAQLDVIEEYGLQTQVGQDGNAEADGEGDAAAWTGGKSNKRRRSLQDQIDGA